MIRRNNEAQTASETNSTNDVGPAPDQAGYQLDCTEVWGGNNVAGKLVKLPGLVGLIHSKPVEPATPAVALSAFEETAATVSRMLGKQCRPFLMRPARFVPSTIRCS